MAHPLTVNRADLLLLGILDRYFQSQAQVVQHLWQNNRGMIASYLAENLGPLMEHEATDGPAHAAIVLLDYFMDQQCDLIIRAAWGRYKGAIAAYLEQEFASRAA